MSLVHSKAENIGETSVHDSPGCKKYRSTPLQAPAQANLSDFLTNPGRPFQVTGADFAGPIVYHRSKMIQSKSYVALYTCATTRAVSLQMVKQGDVVIIK